MLRDVRETTVTLKATTGRYYGMNADHKVTINGVVSGTGRTLSDARADASTALLDALRLAYERLAFGVDDDGTFVVAVAEGSGTSVYRLKADGPVLSGSYGGTPAEVIGRVPHYTALSVR